jgi:hypothetical protein
VCYMSRHEAVYAHELETVVLPNVLSTRLASLDRSRLEGVQFFSTNCDATMTSFIEFVDDRMLRADSS